MSTPLMLAFPKVSARNERKAKIKLFLNMYSIFIEKYQLKLISILLKIVC